MKIKLKLLFVLVFISFFTSCRKDEVRFEESLDEESLVKESVVSNLMKRTVLKDGSKDNIIDGASCITIKLPVDLVVNGNQITIALEDDYQTVKAVFNESDLDDDALIITYPITIILEDFTEIDISSDSELSVYKNRCASENEEDEDIECIDFDYPITFTTYNTLSDKLSVESLDNDKALYEFIDDIEDYLIVNVDFPITLTLFDGTFVNIDKLIDLQTAIQNVINECDEDDDFDFDDDDISNTEIDFTALITQCHWKIFELEKNDQHIESQFNGFEFAFNADSTATATDSSGTVYNGVWAINSNNGLRFTLQFGDFSVISHTWRLKEINPEDNGTQIDLRYIEDELKLKQMCS